jgi:pyrroline-5-carboxylate reductase
MTICISVIGAGVIGGAIARRLIESRAADRVIATRRRVERLKPLEEFGVIATRDNRWAAGEADVIFLCVKPNDVGGVLEGVKDLVEGKLIVSTAAIIPLSYYRSIAPGAKYVRMMPNIATLVGESFTAYTCDDAVTEEDKELVRRLLSTLGPCEEVEEKHLDAITGLSGSGPAYIAIVIDALLYAGLKVGLPRELALRSSAQAVLGTAKLILEGHLDTSKVKEMVTTPGGTTIEGIYQLEDSGIMTAFMRAVESATEKCRLLRERLSIE